MSTIKVFGIDLGKSSFHVVGRDDTDSIRLRKKYTRSKLLEQLSLLEPCTVAFEACGGSHWLARRCLAMGHEVRLIPPQNYDNYGDSLLNTLNAHSSLFFWAPVSSP